MTQLETTINQILSERNSVANREMAQKETRESDERRTQQYAQEFDSIYGQISSIGQIEAEFVEWANQCTINDERKEIVDGTGLYKHLLKKARIAYQRFREEGYEHQTAFDKGSRELSMWIQDSAQKASGGTIYLNHSQQFLSRMRKLADW